LEISKDGYIKPTLVIKPVEIGGVTISRITAFNAKFVVDSKLGKGAKIELIRSGDVIPYIKKVIKPASKIYLPAGKWHWNKSNVDIICDNVDNEDIKIKNIHYFFSLLNTKGLGERNVIKLYEAGIDSVLKILSSNKEDFLEIEGFKEKSANNLQQSILIAMKKIPLERLMTASNKLGHGMGEKRNKSFLLVYPK